MCHVLSESYVSSRRAVKCVLPSKEDRQINSRPSLRDEALDEMYCFQCASYCAVWDMRSCMRPNSSIPVATFNVDDVHIAMLPSVIASMWNVWRMSMLRCLSRVWSRGPFASRGDSWSVNAHSDDDSVCCLRVNRTILKNISGCSGTDSCCVSAHADTGSLKIDLHINRAGCKSPCSLSLLTPTNFSPSFSGAQVASEAFGCDQT